MTTIVDDFSPMYVGDTLVPFSPVFRHADGSAFNLNTATIAMKMQDLEGNLKTCHGLWLIDDAANGKAHYQWQSSDVDTAGTWNLYITVTIGGASVHTGVKQ